MVLVESAAVGYGYDRYSKVLGVLVQCVFHVLAITTTASLLGEHLEVSRRAHVAAAVTGGTNKHTENTEIIGFRDSLRSKLLQTHH